MNQALLRSSTLQTGILRVSQSAPSIERVQLRWQQQQLDDHVGYQPAQLTGCTFVVTSDLNVFMRVGHLLQHARSLLWLTGSYVGGRCSSNISSGVPEPFGGSNSAVRGVWTGK